MPPFGVGRQACVQDNVAHLLLEQLVPSSEPSGQSDMPLQNFVTSTQIADELQANLFGAQFLD